MVSTTHLNSIFEREKRKQSKLMALHSQPDPLGPSQNARKILSLELKPSIKIILIDILKYSSNPRKAHTVDQLL